MSNYPSSSQPPAASSQPPHVSESVKHVRRRVLSERTLLFSHVIPLEFKGKKAESHAAHRLATELGASVVTSTADSVTHVVAGSDGTDKVRWAQKHGKHAVSVEWLASCGYLWRAADEAQTPIAGVSATKLNPAKVLQEQLTTLPPPDLRPSGGVVA